MNILVSAFACDPSRGSEPGIGWNWACELARAGQSVWVLAGTAGRAEIERFLVATPVPGLHMVYIEPPPAPRALGWFRLPVQYLLWQRLALEHALALTREIRFDAVHHVSMGSLQLGSPLWRLGLPFVFGPVGGGQTADLRFLKYFRGGRKLELLRTAFVRFLTPWLLNAKSTVRGARLVLAANRETADWVGRLGARRVELMIDSAIPADFLRAGRRKPAENGRPLRVLWVGRLLPRKAVLLALEAMAAVDAGTPMTCTIVGGGQQGQFLAQWIETLGLSRIVTWRGQIPWAEVQDAYLDHDVFLFTSLRETCGIQLVEAMAHGLPVVALDHQGPRAIVPDSAGIRVPVTTPQPTARALAAALEALARDPRRRAAMGHEAAAFAAQHTWAQKAARAIALYPEIVAGPR